MNKTLTYFHQASHARLASELDAARRDAEDGYQSLDRLCKEFRVVKDELAAERRQTAELSARLALETVSFRL